MVHDDYKEMLAAHALSALDAEDRRALDQHLSECAECRSELADWESTAASLALSAPLVEPSPHVRERIMSAVRSEKQESQHERQSQQEARTQQDARARQDSRSQQDPRVVSFRQSRREMWASFGQVGAIAAAFLCLVLIIWIIVLWQQNRTLRRQMEFMSRDMGAMQRELNRSSEFVTVLSTPGARVTSLSGTGPSPDASAQLAYDRSGNAVLMANGLPPAPAGKEYQLWFIVGNNPPIPGRTFAPDDEGRGELTDEVPRRALESAVFAITLEPAGGSTAPTSAIYLRSGL
jgi:anti-sigma-K factor RskA